MFDIKPMMKYALERYFKREVQEIQFRSSMFIIHIESKRFGGCLDEMYGLYEVTRYGVIFRVNYVEHDETKHVELIVDLDDAKKFKK